MPELAQLLPFIAPGTADTALVFVLLGALFIGFGLRLALSDSPARPASI